MPTRLEAALTQQNSLTLKKRFVRQDLQSGSLTQGWGRTLTASRNCHYQQKRSIFFHGTLRKERQGVTLVKTLNPFPNGTQTPQVSPRREKSAGHRRPTPTGRRQRPAAAPRSASPPGRESGKAVHPHPRRPYRSNRTKVPARPTTQAPGREATGRSGSSQRPHTPALTQRCVASAVTKPPRTKITGTANIRSHKGPGRNNPSSHSTGKSPPAKPLHTGGLPRALCRAPQAGQAWVNRRNCCSRCPQSSHTLMSAPVRKKKAALGRLSSVAFSEVYCAPARCGY